MHAASVHPEPGSNSLMFCIYTLLLPQKHIHQSDLFALLLVSSFFSSSKEFRSLCTSCASSCCSIFNEPLAALSSGQLVYYITSHSPCQYLFSNFFIPFFALRGFSVGRCISYRNIRTDRPHGVSAAAPRHIRLSSPPLSCR